MVFDFSETGKVRVTMDGFVQEMLSDIEVRFPGECETPGKKDLFVVGDSKVVETKEKEFFHTYTAKLLYLAKRVRPDILVAASSLTKRVQCPNDEDINKLERVIKYIRHTKDKGIVLEGSKMLQVEAYVDASHGIHEDFRGHTGSTISIGFGPVLPIAAPVIPTRKPVYKPNRDDSDHGSDGTITNTKGQSNSSQTGGVENSIIIIAVILSLFVFAVILGVYWWSLRKEASPVVMESSDSLAFEFVYVNEDNRGLDTINPAVVDDSKRAPRD